MSKNRKYILEKFEEHLFEKYGNYCSSHGKQPTEKGLLTYLIDHDLIPPKAIKTYAVKEEFGRIAHAGQFTKTQKVHVISDLFEIPEKTIWGILKESHQAQLSE